MDTGRTAQHGSVGVVVIGRNEGQRLVRCLHSVMNVGLPLVYVDSGSTDGSAARGRALGVTVIELTHDRPFTAARGRNSGFEALRRAHPDIAYVQFLDGDTELVPGWISEAVRALEREPSLVAVCGRRRERRRGATVYNRLCDMEWDTPVGVVELFGGDVMVRTQPFEDAGGYDETLIAGEDPDLAVRLRRGGGVLQRLPFDMTLHDADMRTFQQWWRRSVRAGHAFAEGAHRHQDSGFWSHEVTSNWIWGAALPAASVACALPTLGLSLWGMSSLWIALSMRVWRRARLRGLHASDALVYAAFTTMAKVPQAVGQGAYWVARVQGRAHRIIEYKTQQH